MNCGLWTKLAVQCVLHARHREPDHPLATFSIVIIKSAFRHEVENVGKYIDWGEKIKLKATKEKHQNKKLDQTFFPHAVSLIEIKPTFHFFNSEQSPQN